MEKEAKEKDIKKKNVGCLEATACFFITFFILYSPIYQINQAKLDAGTPPGETLDSSFDFLMNIETFFQTLMASGVVTMILVFLVSIWSDGKPSKKSKYDEVKDEILDENF